MYRRFLLILGCAGLISGAFAQTQRRATLTGNSNNGRGKCTVEVVVDGSADIEISGDTATIRNQAGQPPQWRRFECSGRMPANPANFRFAGVDGRGRQQLVRDPQNGGVAVVRIEDKQGGAEAYTFDLMWEGGSSQNTPDLRNDRFPGRSETDRRGDQPRDGNRRFTTDQAVRACQDAVRAQAAQRFNGGAITFGATAIDDQPGRRDWVTGTFDVRGRGQAEGHRFSCSVDFDGGQIRSAEIEQSPNGRDYRNSNDRNANSSRQAQECERAVSERLRRDGYSTVDFQTGNVNGEPGRSDSRSGTIRATRGDRSESFNFSCSFERDNTTVRSVDVTRR